jgi:hypothetical protein
MWSALSSEEQKFLTNLAAIYVTPKAPVKENGNDQWPQTEIVGKSSAPSGRRQAVDPRGGAERARIARGLVRILAQNFFSKRDLTPTSEVRYKGVPREWKNRQAVYFQYVPCSSRAHSLCAMCGQSPRRPTKTMA